MKLLLAIFLISCSPTPKIEYVAHNLPVLITCKWCDTLPPSKDSSYVWLVLRSKELDDSIALIEKQNIFLDSVNYFLSGPKYWVDTIKWTPYYYKHKKKRKK